MRVRGKFRIVAFDAATVPVHMRVRGNFSGAGREGHENTCRVAQRLCRGMKLLVPLHKKRESGKNAIDRSPAL